MEMENMKPKTFVTTMLLFFSSLALAQEISLGPTQDPDVAYRLFNTHNPYYFLKLDTRDGRIWQALVVDRDSNEIEPVNTEPLASEGRVGRFTLYPTTVDNTFILLDQDTGYAWHIRWGAALDRFVVEID
jgi:hypothetical protein